MMILKSLTFALLISFLAAGCSKSNFGVQPLQVNDVVMTSNSTDPAIDKKMQFTVEACLNNATTADHNSVNETSFELVKDNQSTLLRSDMKGCIFWQEELAFNQLSSEHYFKFSRTLNGKGTFGGSQTVSFAMDPWKNSSGGFVDLNVTPLEDASIHNESASPLSSNPAFARTVSVHTYNAQTTPNGTTLRAEINLSPYATRMGLSNDQIREPITTGHFTMELFLLELNKNGNTADTSLLSHLTQPADAADGILNIIADLPLSHVPKQDAQFALAFRLTYAASGNPTQESMLMMDQLVMQSSLPIQSPSQTLDSFASQSSDVKPGSAGSSSPSSTNNGLSANNSGFRIDTLEITSGGTVATSSSTNIAKTIAARVTVCLKDNLSLQAIVDHEFQIGLGSTPDSIENARLATVISDSSGCLHWQTNVNFDGNAPKQWYARTLRIHSSIAPYSNVQQDSLVNLNPSESDSLFFWDARNGAPPSPNFDHAPGSNADAKLAANDLSYLYTGRDFQLDQSMNLVMNRHYQIRFSPYLSRNSAYTTQNEAIPLQNGRLNFKVLLMSGTTPLSMYAGSAAFSGGEVVTDITLPFSISRFPEVVNRNQLILELSDSDPSSSLKSDPLMTTFIALNASGSVGLEKSNLSSETIASEFASAAAKNLEVVSERKLAPKDLEKLGLVDGTEIEKFINANGVGNTQASRFCELLFSTVDSIAACQKNPSSSLSFTAKKPNDGILGATSEQSPDIYSLNTSASAAWRTADSNNTSKGSSKGSAINTSVGVQAEADIETGIEVFGNGPKLELGGSANASLGNSWSWYSSHTLDHTQGTSHDFSIATVHSLVVEEMRIQAVVSPGKCLSVSTQNPSSSNSVYFCTSPLSGKKVSETWYFVHPAFLSGTMVDGNQIGPMNFTAMIQGQNNFNRFKNVLQNKNNTLVFEKMDEPSDSLRQVLVRKFNLDKVDHGLTDKILGENAEPASPAGN